MIGVEKSRDFAEFRVATPADALGIEEPEDRSAGTTMLRRCGWEPPAMGQCGLSPATESAVEGEAEGVL